MSKITILIQTEDDELIPSYGTETASGADVRANVKEPLVLQPGTSLIVPTGIRVEIPMGYEIQVRPRSGYAAKNQVTVLNTPGTIDSDYRGEIGVILINHGKEPFVITPKMRIAQLIVAPVVQANFEMKEALGTTIRGEGKFGHTGTHSFIQ
jgi:dUTP pyrophosphatase